MALIGKSIIEINRGYITMPIYEYKCAKCGEKFELRRGISDSDRDIKCPVCGKESPKRLLSTFGTTSSCGISCAPGTSSGST